MALKRKPLPKRICPVCDRTFQPKIKQQIYDIHLCAMKAYRHRVAQKLERLEKLESKGAA